LASAAGLIAGCGGGGGPALAPVSGRVTVNNKPVTSGWVTFKPDKAKGNTFGGEPMGEINAQGEYTLSTNGKPGAPLGPYKVTVSSSGPTPPDNTKVKVQNQLNTTYLHPDTTPLEAVVTKEPAAGAYDLKLTP